jgi:hypothetical protein
VLSAQPPPLPTPPATPTPPRPPISEQSGRTPITPVNPTSVRECMFDLQGMYVRSTGNVCSIYINVLYHLRSICIERTESSETEERRCWIILNLITSNPAAGTEDAN